MSSDHPWVLKVQEALAAGQAGDAIASDDPYVRMLLAARGRSQRSDLVSIRALAAEMGVSVRTLRRRNNHPDAPQRVQPDNVLQLCDKVGIPANAARPLAGTCDVVRRVDRDQHFLRIEFGQVRRWRRGTTRPSASTACISIRRAPSRSTASSATPCRWDTRLARSMPRTATIMDVTTGPHAHQTGGSGGRRAFCNYLLIYSVK